MTLTLESGNSGLTFDSAIEPFHLLNHPFYRAWMQGQVSREQLQEYARQYYYHVDRFPRYLSAIHSNCESPSARREILANLNDEEGTAYGTSHPDLWLQFAEGLGVTQSEVLSAQTGAAIRKVAETFFQFARSSFHEGLGALYAYESQVPEVAHSKIEGLKTQYGITDEKTLAFFEVHRVADVEHREVLRRMLEALPVEQKSAAMHAAREAAQSLWDFLSAVYPEPAHAC